MPDARRPLWIAVSLLAAGILVTVIPGVSSDTAVGMAMASGPVAVSQGWQNYKSPAGHYSILMPCSPTTETTPTETDLGPIALQKASCATNALFTTVIYYDVPATLGASPDEFLTVTADALVKGSGFVEKAARKKITIDGHPGVEIIGESQDASSFVRARYYLVGSRIYLVMVGTALSDAATPEIDSFFGSFKLN